MIVAGALSVVEHVLRRRAAGLRESGVNLACLQVVVATSISWAGVGFAVELFLFGIEALLLTVPNRLLAIS